MEKPLMRARGSVILPDYIDLYQDRIVIRHPVGSPVEILLRDITAVELESSRLLPGYLDFAVRGQYYLRGRVRFERRFEKGMIEMKTAIQRQIAALNAGTVEQQTGADASIAEIGKWADLKNKGLITEEEYELKRRQILFGADGMVREKEIVKEIVKVPCKYCGTLTEITAAKCDSCGAPLK